MERLAQPEREICRRGWPAMAMAGVGLVVVLFLAGWVLKMAAGRIAISEFKDLTLSGGIGSRRASIPLMRWLTGEMPGGVNTTIAGPDESPTFHPQLSKALWARRRVLWEGKWNYYIGLAYWKEAGRKQGEIGELQRRIAGMRADDVAVANRQIDSLKVMVRGYQEEAFNYLVCAMRLDPANGFWRYTALELSELLQKDPTTQADLKAGAERRVPGSTYLLILDAKRREKEGKVEEAFEEYKRALSHVKTELSGGLQDEQGGATGEAYLGEIVAGLRSRLKSYEAWSRYVPDNAEVHLRLWLYLRGESGRLAREAANLTGAGGRAARQAEAEESAKAAVEERTKGIEAGKQEIQEEKQSALVLYLMGRACQEAGDIDLAVERLSTAVELRPKNVQWWLVLAQAQVEAGVQADRLTQEAKRQGDTSASRKEEARWKQYLNDADASLDQVLELEPSNAMEKEIRKKVQDARHESVGPETVR